MKFSLLLVIVSFAYSTCLELNRCSIYDSKCQLDFFQNMGKHRASQGFPELGIPVIDPFKLTNITKPIMGLWNMTLVEGEAVGIRNCLVTKYETNVEARYKELEMICDKIIIRGNYQLTAHPVLKNTYGDFHGEGNSSMTLENWYFKFRYPFKFVKKANGLIYMNALFEQAVYEARVENVFVEANGLKLGRHDVSKYAVNAMNKHWKVMMASEIGEFMNNKSAQYYYDIYSIFFDNVPAHLYLSDNLEKLVDYSVNQTKEMKND